MFEIYIHLTKPTKKNPIKNYLNFLKIYLAKKQNYSKITTIKNKSNC